MAPALFHLLFLVCCGVFLFCFFEMLVNFGKSECGFQVIFETPGAHLRGPGAHFKDLCDFCDFRDKLCGKKESHVDPIFAQNLHKSAKCGKRTVRMLKSEVRDASWWLLWFSFLFGISFGRPNVLQMQHWLYPNDIAPFSKKSILGSISGSILDLVEHPWRSCGALWAPKVWKLASKLRKML